MTEKRTPKGKLIGIVDERTGFFFIKIGVKTTKIKIPSTGLEISFDSGNGALEEIYIPPIPNTHKIA